VRSTLSKPATKAFDSLRVLIHESFRFVNNAGYGVGEPSLRVDFVTIEKRFQPSCGEIVAMEVGRI